MKIKKIKIMMRKIMMKIMMKIMRKIMMKIKMKKNKTLLNFMKMIIKRVFKSPSNKILRISKRRNKIWKLKIKMRKFNLMMKLNKIKSL
jgi:hypothetical protein